MESSRGVALDWGVGAYERTAERLLPAAEVLVDTAAVQPGEHVLDLGCGTGNAALLAAARGARITAVDPSDRLLAVTHRAAQDQGLPVTCTPGDAAALPVPDSTVDCLLSSFALVFAPDPEAAAAELARVLAPAGRALFTAWLPGGAVGAYAAAGRALVLEAMGAPSAEPGFAWHDEGSVRELFAGHGLRTSLVGRHELVFTAASPSAYLDAEQAEHPAAISGQRVLEQHGRADEARARLLQVLMEHNEDPAAFRATSRYLVFALAR